MCQFWRRCVRHCVASSLCVSQQTTRSSPAPQAFANVMLLARTVRPFLVSCRCLSSNTRGDVVMNVFDRKAKRIQRNRTALLENYEVYDYIKDEVGWRIADRICDVKRKFHVALELGCGRGHVAKNIYQDMVGTLYQCDMAEKVLQQASPSPEVPTYKIHADEEFLPFHENSLDLVVSSLSLHWVNDLPSTFRQVLNSLKNDGCFLGSMFGGDTLYELRVSLQLAEEEKEGGFGAHVSPFTTAQDLGSLMNRLGFTMLTIDVDHIIVRYPGIMELMKDLKGMGENNAAWTRKPMLHRATIKRAAEIYKEMYGSAESEGIPATYQVINFIGWKPDPSQAKAAKRGSGEVSLKDIDKLDQLGKDLDKMKSDGGPEFEKPISQLTEDIEKLRLSTQNVESDKDQLDGDHTKS